MNASSSSLSEIVSPLALNADLISSFVTNPSESASAALKKSETSYSVALAGKTCLGSTTGEGVGVSG